MRLINTTTGQFSEFSESQLPRYAVLSHTWGEEEISYLDMLYISSDLPATTAGLIQVLLKKSPKDSQGFGKVQKCCKLARSRGLDWVWIDTCCIDKSSSAELSEAINSMWRWYRDAEEAYAFLFDVTLGPDWNQATLQQFSKARWFTRGWTLQELLAPKEVFFCNNRWQIFASKKNITQDISNITNIPLVFLDGTNSPSDNATCSVAMRMSWVSKRQTSRTEDIAYCMLGLFDVHMPLIYGEGSKAFMRLQLEILKKVDDDSLYAWSAPLDRSGLLATSPTAFADSDKIVQLNFPSDTVPWLPPVMTSIGLELKSRYERDDRHTAKIDTIHGVHTINAALPTQTEGQVTMVMHCGPRASSYRPLTRYVGQYDQVYALMLVLQRFGATWQRVNCRTLPYVMYGTYQGSRSSAYCSYFIAQQGM